MNVHLGRQLHTEVLDFRCTVITPLFLGGANPVEPELRAAPFRGALRFWWRALYGADYATIQKMFEAESEIFGSTNTKGRLGIALLFDGQPQVKPLAFQGQESLASDGEDEPVIKYLTYGLWGRNPNRKYIAPDFSFTLRLTLRGLDPSAREQVLHSLQCLDFFGNVGAKARNGLGSLDISFQSLQGKLGKISEVLQEKARRPKALFPSVSNQTLVLRRQNAFKTYKEALAELGRIYSSARRSITPLARRACLGLPLTRVDMGKRLNKPFHFHVFKNTSERRTPYGIRVLFLPWNYPPNHVSNFQNCPSAFTAILRAFENEGFEYSFPQNQQGGNRGNR